METPQKDILADLNILHDPANPSMTAKMVRFAMELGYDTVAINQEVVNFTGAVETLSFDADGGGRRKRKKAARQVVDIPEPFSVQLTAEEVAKLSVRGKKFRLFSRLSIVLDDLSLLHKIVKHPNVSRYDILAMYPQNEQAFSTLVNKANVDIICFDLTSRVRWVSKGRLAQMAVRKGIAFEIAYSAALSDSSVRREVFSNARCIVNATRGKCIVISSRARRPLDLRGPYDVMNMAVLFGLNLAQSRAAVSTVARQSILRSLTRKTEEAKVLVRSAAECSSSLVDCLAALETFEAPETKKLATGAPA